MTTRMQNKFWRIQLSWRFKIYCLENGFCIHFHVAQFLMTSWKISGQEMLFMSG